MEMLIDDYFCQVLPAKRIRHEQWSLRPLKVLLTKDQIRTFEHLHIWLIIFRREVYGTGLEVVITMDLVGLMKGGMQEIDKAKRELGLKIEKCDRGAATFTVVYGQVN